MTKQIKAPTWLLDKEGCKIFKKIIDLDENDILSKSDTILLALLVDAIIDFKIANADIAQRTRELTVAGERGERMIVNPSVAIKQNARGTMLKILAEMGSTPKARKALELLDAETDALSPFEIALKQRAERKAAKSGK